MGCYPLGKMVSMALGSCNGRKRHRRSSRTTTIVYSPPPSYSYTRSMARSTVTFDENPEIIMVPSEPTQSPTVTRHHHHHHHVHAEAPVEVPSPSPQPEVVHQPTPPATEPAPSAWSAAPEPDHHRHGPRPHKMPEPARVRFAPEPSAHPVRKEPVQVRFTAGPQGGPSHHDPTASSSAAYHPGSGYNRYMMSPLPDDVGDRRRREYFSGEYHYYPTPVREGIYKIATDANRLSTIFSEENPDACSIV